ncbi:hypothetical protein Clacol_002364 [Clathrus columnatus]|uniref:Fungal-type protein kinase domain-containing protein n=1 Tax=Clathrus columnatus TaxID=1419009 RepID=A0AAV5A556_9AGAM|nr:hypothetical protein Clacol_002364 [Clathrus columnatus]
MTRHNTPILSPSSSLSQFSAQAQREFGLEYSGHVYGSENLFSNIFRSTISEREVKVVTDDCIRKFKSLSSFPPVSALEPAHYQPFVERLNAVKESLTHNTRMEDSIYFRVKFEVYGREMAESVGEDAPLRPDALARILSGDPDDRVFWEDVELCVEVKNRYRDMIIQGATYARSMFYAQRNRRFVLMIFFNQKQRQASFGLFSPAWLCLSTNHHDLSVEAGQRGFVQDMIQIWSCTNRWSAGFEDSCNNLRCFLGKLGTFSYCGNICCRTTLRGRRTRVDLIDNGDIWTNQNEYHLPGPQPESVRSSARIAENHLALLRGRGADSPSELPISITTPDPKYKTLILKDSWPPVSRRTQEARVFGIAENNDEVKDEQAGGGDNDGDEREDEKHQDFGIPVILDCFFGNKLRRRNIRYCFGTLPIDGRSLSTFWDDDGSEQSSNLRTGEPKPKKPKPNIDPPPVESCDPEERVHAHLVISTQGVPLDNADGPRQLLQAVLHAMIGYSVIFNRCWLHRDVSIGNVLLMKTPKTRKGINGFEDILTQDILEKYFKKCTGFISDGDLVVNWDQVDRERAKQRSTTLKSRDLATLRTKREFLDTLWEQQLALDKQQKHKNDDPLLPYLPSPAFKPFVELLGKWLTLAFSEEAFRVRDELQSASVEEHKESSRIGLVNISGKESSI